MRQLIRRPSRAYVPFLVVALMAPAAAVRAETPTTPAPATAPTTAPRSVMYEAAQVAARPTASAPVEQQRAAAEAVRMERHVGAGKNAALMIVGAAGIVTGAVVGGGAGTAIALGGAAVGLYGLYRFMK